MRQALSDGIGHKETSSGPGGPGIGEAGRCGRNLKALRRGCERGKQGQGVTSEQAWVLGAGKQARQGTVEAQTERQLRVSGVGSGGGQRARPPALPTPTFSERGLLSSFCG